MRTIHCLLEKDSIPPHLTPNLTQHNTINTNLTPIFWILLKLERITKNYNERLMDFQKLVDKRAWNEWERTLQQE